MKISKTACSAFIVFLTFFGIVIAARVSAQTSTITDQQIEHILTNCTSTKNTLNQLHASDALLRVNRGQIYESMSTKLMSGFNERLANNKYNNDALVSVTSNYNSSLDGFRLDYKKYEEHLSQAIGIDCKKQPFTFFDAVLQARSDRVRVHDDILKLNQLVDQYQAEIVQFEKDHTNSNNSLGH